MTFPEGEIRQTDRLVPSDFKPDVKAELRAALTAPKPEDGYPPNERRLKMTPDQIAQWKANGMHHEELLRKSDEPPFDITNSVMDHPNYLKGLGYGKATVDDGTQDFRRTSFRESMLPDGYQRDSRGIPIHPEIDLILENGAVTGTGYYWYYGPNPSATAYVFGEKDGKLHALLINGDKFAPGGIIDVGETPVEAAVREAKEETDFQGEPEFVYALPPKLLGSRRITTHAWEESAGALIVPKDQNIDNHPLKAGDDATGVKWTVLNEGTLNNIFLPHANDIRLAVLAYEKQYGKRIAPDGTINALAA